MLLEYADRGALQEACDKGVFQVDGAPSAPAILRTALEIAEGMAFLHDRGIVHSDLTGGNILLASAEDAPHGVTTKVADFGLSREMDARSKVETRTYGTVTHMPPELLESGIISKAADGWSFGVLLWEMWHGCRAWASLNHAQVINAVAVAHEQLRFDAAAPRGIVELAAACMSRFPNERPTFHQAPLLSII